MWAEQLPADPSHALQTLVSRLRRDLGPDVLRQESDGYRLALDPGAVDALAFERLAAEGAAALRAGDAARADETLTEGLALWRGPALSGTDGLVMEAARLEDLRLSARADRIAAGLALGRGAELVPEVEALVAEHPLDERLAAHHLAALAAAGRPADALAAYERMRRRLDDELGAIPSPELQAAHAAVLRGEPAERPADNLPHARSSFVGREREVAEVAALLERAPPRDARRHGRRGQDAARDRGGARGAAARVWLVELAAVDRSPTWSPARCATRSGLREVRLLESNAPPPVQAREQLRGALAGRDALLVLDNCEHLIEAAAELADDLLACCPGVRILATSREPLAIAGERLLAVSPLGLPEGGATAEQALAHPAVELLADRGARRLARASPSPTRTSRPWSRSAAGSTGCRWPSSSPPRGCARCRRSRSPPASTTASGC